MTKISQLSSIGDSLAIGDQFLIRDIDDTGSPNKSVTVSGITRALNLGTAAAPAIAFASDKNTGIYSPGADQVAISTNTQERLRITSAGLVGIGTSSPNTNSQLHVVGSGYNPLYLDTTIAGGGGISLLQGNVQALYAGTGGSSWLSGSATTDGLVRAEANLLFATGGNNERMRIDSSGHVGVGTASPSDTSGFGGTLDINGTTGAACYVRTNGSATDYGLIGHYGADFYVNNNSNGPTLFLTNGSERLRIDSSGVVKLTQSGSNPRYGSLETSSDAFKLKAFSGNASHNATMQFFTGADSPTERLRIDSSGRLLVGTSSYAGNGKLVTAGNTGGNAGTFDICWGGSRPTAANTDIGYIRWYSADNSSANAHYASIYASSDGTSSSGSDIPGRLTFSTTRDGQSSPTEAMRITQAGKLILNDTSTAASARFGITADLNNDNGLLIKNSVTQGAGQNFVTFLNSAANTAGAITHNGTTTVNYATSSDYRLKENVVAVIDGITRLQQLKPNRFNFIADPDKTVDGFIAHEVQDVVPEAINGTKDEIDDEGNPIYQGIDQSKLVPLLTAALQEAIAKIETLEQRLSDAGIA